MSEFTIGELLQIITTVMAAVAVIITNKTDLKWVIKWCADHKEQDDQRFQELKQELRSLRRAEHWFDEG